GNASAGAERTQLLFVHLLLLMRDVLAVAGFAEPVAFDRAREDHGRRTLVLGRRFVGVEHFDWIVAAEGHLLQLVVRQVLDHVEQARVSAPEVLADVGAVGDGVLLILAVDDLAHPLDEQALAIPRAPRLPPAAPYYLDHVTAG